MTDRLLHYRTCPLCEATCGLEVAVEGDASDGKVVRIRGDRDDVFSHGLICPKGSTLKQLREDPDRLSSPLVKRDGRHVEVSWNEAFAEIERRMLPVIEEHGRESVAIYQGNPAVHIHALTIYGRALISALGTRNIYSAGTVDQMPRHVSSGFLYGDPLAFPLPDLDRTDYLLMLGANPYESNGSLATAPGFPGRLQAIRERGGRLVVVDPRRTKTANAADEHLMIRPGSDAAWLAALAHVLFDEDLVDTGAAGDHLDGVDDLRRLVAPFTPEAVEHATWIAAEVTRRIARELAAAPTAAVYGRIGTNAVPFGTLASWLTDVVTTLTGNLDQPGGMMWTHPAHLPPHKVGPGRGFVTGRRTTRVSGRPETKGEFPVAALPEEIETPGPGELRVLVTVAGNPARSIPDSDRTDAALASLDVMISVDPYLNETTRHADVILPPPSQLARSHYDLAFYGQAIRNIANYSPRLFDPQGPCEEDIIARLAMVASGQGADGDPQLIHDMVLDSVLHASVKPGRPLEGHDAPGTRLNVAATHPGVNSNVLTDGSIIDPLSGNAVLNGIPVEVTPAPSTDTETQRASETV